MLPIEPRVLQVQMVYRDSGLENPLRLPLRQPANAFLLPDELEYWPVPLPPRGNATVFVHHEVGLTSVNDTREFLIACGASLASMHGIQPQEIILGESRNLLSLL
jgi:hypothetical protein